MTGAKAHLTDAMKNVSHFPPSKTHLFSQRKYQENCPRLVREYEVELLQNGYRERQSTVAISATVAMATPWKTVTVSRITESPTLVVTVRRNAKTCSKFFLLTWLTFSTDTV